MWQMKLVYRRGFTLFLTFVAVLLLVFATLLAQTSEMIHLLKRRISCFRALKKTLPLRFLPKFIKLHFREIFAI
jgi:Tfp pilus assembly protein PilX